MSPRDPATSVFTAMLLVAATIAASCVSARFAAAQDPFEVWERLRARDSRFARTLAAETV